jgi:hypothetical protein
MRVIRAEQLTRSGDSSHATLAMSCVHSARAEIAGVVMELRTDLPEVARLFGLRYADHATAREPDFRYYVATARSGYAFWSDHAPSWRWTQGALPPDAVVFLADAVIVSAVIRYDPAIASIHAAALEFQDTAIAIAGNSGPAKTAAMLACARRNMRIYSDERALVRDGVVYPFLRRSSARAAGARLLLADREGSNEPLELSVKMCFGPDAIAEPRRLGALFVIAGSGSSALLEHIDAADALPAITRWFDARGDLMDRVTRAIALLRGVHCFRLVLGTPDETAVALAYAVTMLRQ